ncbi:unnamed protein product [Tilletia controversa]|nr:unnamed protein product [Tilletia controversa]
MDVDVVRRGKRESSPEWGSPIQPTSFQLDEAEEYDSPPHDSDLDLTSLPGEDCDDDEEVSEDGSVRPSDPSLRKMTLSTLPPRLTHTKRRMRPSSLKLPPPTKVPTRTRK